MDNDLGRSTLPCVILAGGRSSRFGAPKGLAELAGRRLIDHVIDRLSAQTSGDIAVNGDDDHLYASLNLTRLSDHITGKPGPLAGVHAAMIWARERGAPAVFTSPVDTPFLPAALMARLETAGAPAVAASGGRRHPLCALWPTTLAADLEARIGGGLRAVRDWADIIDATSVVFTDEDGRDPFFNVNTREDLAAAEAMLSTH